MLRYDLGYTHHQLEGDNIGALTYYTHLELNNVVDRWYTRTRQKGIGRHLDCQYNRCYYQLDTLNRLDYHSRVFLGCPSSLSHPSILHMFLERKIHLGCYMGSLIRTLYSSQAHMQGLRELRSSHYLVHRLHILCLSYL